MGARPGTQPAIFTRVLALSGDPARGRGTLHTNPLPPGCDHHRTSITRASIIYSIKSPTQRFLRAFRAKDRRSDEGEGGKAHNPLPPGCDHQQSPITRAPARNKMYIPLEVQCWPQVPEHAPPPTRASRPPPTFLCSVIHIVYIKSIMKYVADHAQRICMKSFTKYTADRARRFFQSNVLYLYSLYV
jgi:hypothetical protein